MKTFSTAAWSRAFSRERISTGRPSATPSTGLSPSLTPGRPELGTAFTANVGGNITAVRAYAIAQESGDHTVRIWRVSDQTLVYGPITWNYGGSLGGGSTGWQNLPVNPPLAITADAEYVVTVSSDASGNYPSVSGYFGSGGSNGFNLSYPAAAGRYTYFAGQMPNESFQNASYFRDVVFAPSGLPGPSGFAAWADGFPGLTDTSFNGDPDGDGIQNGVEYALGGDPRINDSSNLLLMDTSSPAETVFTFLRDSGAASTTTQIFQYSPDLENWTDLRITPPTATEVDLTDPPFVTITIPRSVAPGGKFFGRLRVTENP